MAVTMTKGRRLLGELAAGTLRPFCAPFVPEAGAGSLCPRRKRRRPLLVRGPHPPSRCRLVFILYPENWRPMSTWRAKLRIYFEFIAHRAPWASLSTLPSSVSVFLVPLEARGS